MRTERAEPSPDAGRDVFTSERRERIADVVDAHGRARVADLAERFGVSTVTIRKDLVALEAEHRVIRAYGGAIRRERPRTELPFDVRDRLRADEKGRIATAALCHVRDGESIVMDASTSVLALGRALVRRGGWSQLTVITNGLRLATELAAQPGITVLMLGGRVRWEALSVVGQLGEGLFSRVNVQTAFVGAAGFSVASGLADSSEEEAQIKRAMVDAASDVIALVDHTKWERAAFATFCPTDQVRRVLTDAAAPAAMLEQLRGLGVRVEVVAPGG